MTPLIAPSRAPRPTASAMATPAEAEGGRCELAGEVGAHAHDRAHRQVDVAGDDDQGLGDGQTAVMATLVVTRLKNRPLK